MPPAEIATEDADLLNVPSNVGRDPFFLATHQGVDQRHENSYKFIELLAGEIHRGHLLRSKHGLTQHLALGYVGLQIHLKPPALIPQKGVAQGKTFTLMAPSIFSGAKSFNLMLAGSFIVPMISPRASRIWMVFCLNCMTCASKRRRVIANPVLAHRVGTFSLMARI
jgi:hypothetical protein